MSIIWLWHLAEQLRDAVSAMDINVQGQRVPGRQRDRGGREAHASQGWCLGGAAVVWQGLGGGVGGTMVAPVSDYADTWQGQRDRVRKVGSRRFFVWAMGVRRLHAGFPDVCEPPPVLLPACVILDVRTGPQTFNAQRWVSQSLWTALSGRLAVF